MKFFIVTILLSGIAAQSAPFRNLAFEEANTNNVMLAFGDSLHGHGTTADLLPGWQLFSGDQPVTQLGFNSNGNEVLSQLSELFTPGSPGSGLFAPDGNFAFLMKAPLGNDTYFLTQRGDIPTDARYLGVKTLVTGAGVLVDGEVLFPVAGIEPIDGSARIKWYDIANYAGRNVELKFGVRGSTIQVNGAFLDSIMFTTSIPEPGTVALFALGGAVLWGLAKRRSAPRVY